MLRAAMSQPARRALTSRELYDVMDLCIEGQSVPGRMPVGRITWPRSRSILAEYQQEHVGVPLRSRLFVQ